MNGVIYLDKIIVFPANAVNALQAASKINRETFCKVQTFESVVVVSIDSDINDSEKYGLDLEKTINRIKEILNIYEIGFKIKTMKF